MALSPSFKKNMLDEGKHTSQNCSQGQASPSFETKTGVDLLGWDDDSSPFWLNLNGAELNRLVCEEFPF